MPNNIILSEGTKFYYILYAARYLAQFISVFFEVRRKDFVQMQAHHVSTMILVLMSYACGFVKIGLVIMFLMDTTDPFLHLGKMLVYLREVSPKAKTVFSFKTTADCLFGFFVLTFTLTRVIIYPFVAFSGLKDLLMIRTNNDGSQVFSWDAIDLLKKYMFPEEAILEILLLAIYLLNLFWFYLLMKMVKRTLYGEQLVDGRSDSEVEQKKNK